MAKLFKYLIVLIVVLFVAVIVVWGFLPTIISSELTKRAGVPVNIASLQIYPSQISIDHFSIGSPPKSILPESLNIQETDIDAPLTRYFSDDIVIDEITMDSIYLGIEIEKKGSSKSNWSYIMANLNKGKKEAEGKKATKVLIKRVLLTNLNVELAYKDQNGRIQKLQPIKRLELKNISSEGGIPSAQITHIILKEALRNIFSLEGLQNLVEDVINPSSDGFLQPFKGIFGETEEAKLNEKK